MKTTRAHGSKRITKPSQGSAPKRSAQSRKGTTTSPKVKLERRCELLVKLLWTVSEAAELLNLHPQTIYKALEKQDLSSAWICGKILIPRDALVAKFHTDFPALLADLQLELGPISSDLLDQLERNRSALLKPLWTASELAALTGLHPQTIYKGIDEKDIVSSRLGAKILVPREPFLRKFGMNVRVLLGSLRIDAPSAA